MHSSLVRIQNVFGYFTSVAFAVAAVIALSALLSAQTPTASLQLKDVKVARGRPHIYATKREEYAHVTFNLDADLSTLFNWNTKQVYLYVTASYPADSKSKDTPASEAMIWDAIIPADDAPWHANTYVHPTPGASSAQPKKNKKSKSSSSKPYPKGTQPGIIRLSGQRPKYQITDATGKIAARTNATLTLHWNVQPYVGLLTWTNRATYGRWKGLVGGRSETFDFPALKTGEAAAKKEDLKVEKGGEQRRDPLAL